MLSVVSVYKSAEYLRAVVVFLAEASLFFCCLTEQLRARARQMASAVGPRHTSKMARSPPSDSSDAYAGHHEWRQIQASEEADERAPDCPEVIMVDASQEDPALSDASSGPPSSTESRPGEWSYCRVSPWLFG